MKVYWYDIISYLGVKVFGYVNLWWWFFCFWKCVNFECEEISCLVKVGNFFYSDVFISYFVFLFN